MKIGVCTTTIRKPEALKVLRKFAGHNVKFFVALDRNSDFKAVSEWGDPDAHFCWMTPDWQNNKFKCSDALGWCCLARRNTAFLAALEWGCDVVYSHDDDNLVTEGSFFEHIETNFESFNGIKVSSQTGWFDPGSLLIPTTRHRGIPWDNPTHSARRAEPVTNAKIGVAAGLVIGDPDIDATTRMELKPDIGQVHILGSTGVVVDPDTWTVFNSQNTAVIRELVPAWFMMPGVGRHDDIYASLIVQRVARDRGLHVHFGPPFTYQQRNDHNLISDLRAEIDGMENVSKLAAMLDGINLSGKSVIDDVRTIYRSFRCPNFIPLQAIEAAFAWLEDIEGIL